MKRKPLAGRYFLLDEIRGFAVICMVFFHAFYTCFETLSIGFFGDLINFFLPAEPFFAAGFIFISGKDFCNLKQFSFLKIPLSKLKKIFIFESDGF